MTTRPEVTITALGAAGGFDYELRSWPTPSPVGMCYEIVARKNGTHVGFLGWHSTGHGLNVHVTENQRRRGVATQMWRYAKELTPRLRHSRRAMQTDEGAAFAAATGP